VTAPTAQTPSPSPSPSPTPQPPTIPGGWPDLLAVTRPDGRTLAAIVAAALGTDLAVRSGINGLAGALLVAVVAGGLLATGRITNRRAWPALALAPLFGLGLLTRAAEWLVFLDIVAAAGLLLLGASTARRGDLGDQSIPDLLGRAVHVGLHAVLAPAFFVGRRTAPADGERPGTTGAVVRGILLGAPVVLVLALLLGSADPVFASFLPFPTDAGDVVIHLVLLTIGAWGAATLLRTASAEPYDVRSTAPRPLGGVEAVTVLGGLVAVFLAFTAAQIATVLGGADYVRRTAGLSYAEHARHGFFQLLAAAAITLGVLLALRATVRVVDRRFVVLSEAAVALTLVLVAGAVRRLGLYEQVYGLTLLRLFAVLFAIWIGGVFVLLAFSLAGVHRQRAWFVPAALALGLAGLLALNVANPEARIVHRNVDRLATSDHFDAAALGELSDDAVPAMVDDLDRLDPADRAIVLDRICAGHRSADGGFWAFNAARDAAVEARQRVCPLEEA
jgi:hypothetical protein